MGANRGREIPDATPPFLTKELIVLWIGEAEARQKEAMSALKSDVKDELHKFDRGQLHLIGKVEKLAGDGEQDIGAVARIERQLNEYIAENRAASSRASSERQELSTKVTAALDRIDILEEAGDRTRRTADLVDRWKLIPIFTRNLWKVLAAIAAFVLVLFNIWSALHPQPVTLTPQQVQEIRRGH
jgi:hypothetical protein